MARVLRSRTFVRPPKRTMIWLGADIARIAVIGAGSTLLATLNAGALLLRPFTIIRSRFTAFIRSDQAGASEDQELGLGMAVVSDTASAIGVTAVPTPITDMGSDLFFFYELLMSRFAFRSATGADAFSGLPYVFDSKAMRKVALGSDISITAEGGSSNDGTVLTLGGRMLIKLH